MWTLNEKVKVTNYFLKTNVSYSRQPLGSPLGPYDKLR